LHLLVALAACVTLSTGCQATPPVASAAAAAQVQSALPPSQDPLWTSLSTTAPGDRFHVLNRGDEALTWRLRAIDTATSSIDLQTFLWLPDTAGRAILVHILAAADRGVRVRILLDDSFTVGEGDAISAVSQHPNIDVRIYNPFQQRPDNLALRQVANATEFSRIDHRMHNKAMITDGRVAIVGGRNLADEYFGLNPTANFRDFELLTFGPVVGNLSRLFDRYWRSPWSVPAADVFGAPTAGKGLAPLQSTLTQQVLAADKTESKGERATAWKALARTAIAGQASILADEPAQVDPARETPNQLANALIKQIDQARTELVLISAYLVPTPELADAIHRAQARGVRVRILTNSLRSNNHTAAHSAYRGFVRSLLGYGVELHEVRALAKDRSLYMVPPVDTKHLGLHAKVILLDDDLSFVGSANLDPRSLNINTEMGLLVRSEQLARQVRGAFGVDFETRNAWHLEETANGDVRWVGDDQVLTEQPAESQLQRLEDWFFSGLPIRDKM
jgi:putative cardiolipin synthase